MKFFDPVIKSGEAFRSNQPRDKEGDRRRRPDVYIVSAHGRNVAPGPEMAGNDTARKVEYTIGDVTHVLPETILRGVLERKAYKQKNDRRDQSEGAGVVSPDGSEGAVAVVDGEKDVEMRRAHEMQLFALYGEGLLQELDSVEASEISGEGYSDDQNWSIRADFILTRNRLQELVRSYQKQKKGRRENARALQEIVQFAKSIPEEFLSGEQREKMAQFVSYDPADKQDRKQQKQRHQKKKLRSGDEDPRGKSAAAKGVSKQSGVRARRPKADVASAEGVGSESSSKGMPGERDNGGRGGDPTRDFQTFLDRDEALMKRRIADLQNQDDFDAPLWLHTLKDGTRVFVDMTDENGLKEIHDEFVDNQKTFKAEQLQSQWIEANHRLEMMYLRQRLMVEINAGGVAVMSRIHESNERNVLLSIGRTTQRSASIERIFIPRDAGNSINDPSGTEGIRAAIQDMISLWRENRVPKEYKGNDFEAYFKKEFSGIIDKSNKRIQEFFDKKWAEMEADAKRSKNAGPVKRVRRKNEQPETSTEVLDVIALEKQALRMAERHFRESMIPFIEGFLSKYGLDLLWLFKVNTQKVNEDTDVDQNNEEKRKEYLSFILDTVGNGIAELIVQYIGKFPEAEKRLAFEIKIREAAMDMLFELVEERMRRMVEDNSAVEGE